MSNESRAKFEEWYEKDHSGGIDSLSSDWDEERNCYKNHANHLAWKAYDSRQSEIDSLLAENELLKGEISVIRQANFWDVVKLNVDELNVKNECLRAALARAVNDVETFCDRADEPQWTDQARAALISNVRGK